ncbi:MAG: Stp1/IreP family PP2C-type Ser/Thr phosphatase [Solirubrobacteraceae bacterium]
MLRVSEQYAGTDTGRQRRANEDSLLARSPLFVVADGMGGAQAGEVASRIAVESFQPGVQDASDPELALAELARAANSRIHELSHTSAEHAGMGTTLTAVYVGELELAIAHVGDSRAYCLRDGQLERLTDDHSLVDELMRQGRLTPEEAVEHPQRSVITRALGPEATVEVDTRTVRARPGDVYLICSDGLTTMIGEEQIAELLLAHPRLRDAGEALIAAANEAGGRDNITVVLLRLEDVQVGRQPPEEAHATLVGVPALSTPQPTQRRVPRAGFSPAPQAGTRRRRRPRHAGVLATLLGLLVVLGSAGYLAFQSVYFIGTNNRGLVTMFEGVPYRLPGNLALYSSQYVSGVSASTLSSEKRSRLFDHLRSESDAGTLIHSLELDQLE